MFILIFFNFKIFLLKQNADFKVYTVNNAVTPKSYTGSVYVNMNIKDFSPNDRINLEILINSFQSLSLNTTNSITKILSSEDYYDMTNSNLITRIYFSVRIIILLILN